MPRAKQSRLIANVTQQKNRQCRVFLWSVSERSDRAKNEEQKRKNKRIIRWVLWMIQCLFSRGG